MAKGLSEREKRFVQEYLIDLNATQAAKRAGYSEHSARAIGSENLSKPDIQEAIQEAMEKRSKRTQVSQDRVVLELARVAFSNIRKYVSWGPNGVDLGYSENLEEDDAACVAEVSETVTEAGGSRKFKLHDKIKALELLGKHLGIYKKDGESGSDGSSESNSNERKLSPAEWLEVLRARQTTKGE